MRTLTTYKAGVTRNRPRRLPCLIALAVALLVSLGGGVSAAEAYSWQPKPGIPQSLLQAAQQNPTGYFDVILQGNGSQQSSALAGTVASQLGLGTSSSALGDQLKAQFPSIGGVEISLSGQELLELAKSEAIGAISENAEVIPLALANPQKWDDVVGVSWFWRSPHILKKAPTIAIIDSGIDNASAQFGSRILKQVEMGGGDASGDSRGHGTFVAALAAGSGYFSGAAPTANLVSLDVFDAQGRAETSDVIRAVDWILAHKDEYNIRVANFSLQTAEPSSFLYDPLDQAVERLWRAGVVVVTAAGNYASNYRASGVLCAPANDPFVITVGATDIRNSTYTIDDSAAPWSAYGYTVDGFAKPEIGAPGRYLIGQIPVRATLIGEFIRNVLYPGMLQLSGTSFSSAIVSGMAADLLGVHPDWTPDQVKGALMASASPLPWAMPGSIGVGEVNLWKAFSITNPANPNAGLNQFLVPDPSGGPLPVFDGDSWMGAVQSNPAWNSASWSSASWASASWSSASWASASWSSASWASASWSSASWASASWSSASWANGAATDGRGSG